MEQVNACKGHDDSECPQLPPQLPLPLLLLSVVG